MKSVSKSLKSKPNTCHDSGQRLSRCIALKQLPSRNFSIFPDQDSAIGNLLQSKLSNIECQKLRRGSSISRHISVMDVDFITTVKNRMLDSDPDKREVKKIKAYLKGMNARISVKRIVKHKIISKHDYEEDITKPGKLFWLSFYFYTAALYLKLYTTKLYNLCAVWKRSIEGVHSRFGSGVASYFTLIKELFLLNLINFLALTIFLVFPQLMYDFSVTPGSGKKRNFEFKPLQLITGTGWMNDTVLYYGKYTNATFELFPGFHYDLPFFYLVTFASLVILNLAVVAYWIAHAYSSARIGSHTKAVFCKKLFSSWDFSFVCGEIATLRKQCIQQELMELLCQSNKVTGVRQSVKDKILEISMSVVLNLFSLCFMIMLSFGVLEFLKKVKLDMGRPILQNLEIPIGVSAIILAYHYLLAFFARFEPFVSNEQQLYYTVIRVAIMRNIIICILMYYWAYLDNGNTKIECYYSVQGQRFYRLILVGFLLSSFIFFAIGGVWKCVSSIAQRLGYEIRPPGFNVAFHSNDIIYYQTLVWCGSFFSPLLSFLYSVVLILMFYGMMGALTFICVPRQKYWSAANAKILFRSTLMICFVLSMVLVIVAVAQFISPDCGPFQKNVSLSAFVAKWFRVKSSESKSFKQFSTVIELVSLQVAIVIAIFVAIFYAKSTYVANHQAVKFYEDKVLQASKDKAYLLRCYEEEIYERLIVDKKFKHKKTVASRGGQPKLPGKLIRRL